MLVKQTMLVKEKFYKIFYISFFIILLSSPLAKAEIRNKLIQKINTTNTLSFNFEQKIKNKKQTGSCHIKYPKLINCNYNDSFKKMLISNGKTLAVIQKRYKKIWYYPLKKTPLYYLLDKEYLIRFVSNSTMIENNKNFFHFHISEDEKVLDIFFDKNTFDLKGWKTRDVYKNEVEFFIINQKVNVPVNSKIFKIPRADDL